MDESSDAIGSDVELHSMMNAAPTMEEVTMEEAIPVTEPETTQPEPTSAVIEEQTMQEEEEQAIDTKQLETPANPEPTTTNNDLSVVQDHSANITNSNDVPTVSENQQQQRPQQQDRAYNSCILSQSSVDAQMEKVIDNIVELSGQFAPNLEQQEGPIDKDKEVEHIQREIIGERNVLPENPTHIGDVGRQDKPDEPKTVSNIEKPALIESLPQLPDLTKLAHEIVPEITSHENSSCLKIQEIDQEKLVEKSIVLEKVEEVIKAGQDVRVEDRTKTPPKSHFNSVSELNQPKELNKEEHPSTELSVPSPSKKKQEGLCIKDAKHENEARKEAKETRRELKEARREAKEATRREQEEIEELEKLAKESEQKSEENSMVEDEDFSAGNHEPAPVLKQPVDKGTMKFQNVVEPVATETKPVEEDSKQKEPDVQTRSGRPVRAVRNRTSTRLASPEEPKTKSEKKHNKRTHDQMEQDAPARSCDKVIKAPIKLTLRPASSRATIATAAPAKKPEKPIKKPAITPKPPIVDGKKYNCDYCPFSTDRLNNIVYHKQKVCQHTFEVFNAQVEDWKKTLSSPKSNSKRFSR